MSDKNEITELLSNLGFYRFENKAYCCVPLMIVDEEVDKIKTVEELKQLLEHRLEMFFNIWRNKLKDV